MILAIDTATRAVSLALHDGHQVLAEESWRTENYHTTELAPTLEKLLRRSGVAVGDLRAIAVARGPGSFTGLRIGMSLAKGLALASSPTLPLIGVPTLDIVAAAQPHRADTLWVVAQAGRGRINAGAYRWDGERWQSREAPFIVGWEDFISRLKPPVQISGEIDLAGRAQLERVGGHVIIASAAESLRRAGFLAELGWERLSAGEVDDPVSLTPIYLH